MFRTTACRIWSGALWGAGVLLCACGGGGAAGGGAPPANRPPQAHDAYFVASAAAPLRFAVPASDPDGDPLTALVEPGGEPVQGDAAYDPAGGEFVYTVTAPDPVGADAFSFRVSDGRHQSDPATVTLRLPHPDVRGAYPVAAVTADSLECPDPDLTATLLTPLGLAGGTVSVNLQVAGRAALLLELDTGRGPLLVVENAAVSTARAVIGGPGGQGDVGGLKGLEPDVQGTLADPAHLTLSFAQCTGSAGLDLDPAPPHANQAPIAGWGTLATPAGTPIHGNLLGQVVIDPDGGPGAWFEAAPVSAKGTLAVPGPFTGDFTYTPGGTGTDTFTVFYHDGEASVTVPVAVNVWSPGGP